MTYGPLFATPAISGGLPGRPRSSQATAISPSIKARDLSRPCLVAGPQQSFRVPPVIIVFDGELYFLDVATKSRLLRGVALPVLLASPAMAADLPGQGTASPRSFASSRSELDWILRRPQCRRRLGQSRSEYQRLLCPRARLPNGIPSLH